MRDRLLELRRRRCPLPFSPSELELLLERCRFSPLLLLLLRLELLRRRRLPPEPERLRDRLFGCGSGSCSTLPPVTNLRIQLTILSENVSGTSGVVSISADFLDFELVVEEEVDFDRVRVRRFALGFSASS